MPRTREEIMAAAGVLPERDAAMTLEVLLDIRDGINEMNAYLNEDDDCHQGSSE